MLIIYSIFVLIAASLSVTSEILDKTENLCD